MSCSTALAEKLELEAASNQRRRPRPLTLVWRDRRGILGATACERIKACDERLFDAQGVLIAPKSQVEDWDVPVLSKG